jgi:hypothetical protein
MVTKILQPGRMKLLDHYREEDEKAQLAQLSMAQLHGIAGNSSKDEVAAAVRARSPSPSADQLTASSRAMSPSRSGTLLASAGAISMSVLDASGDDRLGTAASQARSPSRQVRLMSDPDISSIPPGKAHRFVPTWFPANPSPLAKISRSGSSPNALEATALNPHLRVPTPGTATVPTMNPSGTGSSQRGPSTVASRQSASRSGVAAARSVGASERSTGGVDHQQRASSPSLQHQQSTHSISSSQSQTRLHTTRSPSSPPSRVPASRNGPGSAASTSAGFGDRRPSGAMPTTPTIRHHEGMRDSESKRTLRISVPPTAIDAATAPIRLSGLLDANETATAFELASRRVSTEYLHSPLMMHKVASESNLRGAGGRSGSVLAASVKAGLKVVVPLTASASASLNTASKHAQPVGNREDWTAAVIQCSTEVCSHRCAM